ncbi:uncharacterized protein LOC144276727 isoform X1 [Eretmochelys imbricata]
MADDLQRGFESGICRTRKQSPPIELEEATILKGQVTAKKELGGSDFSKAQDYAMKKNILEANERGQNSVVRRITDLMDPWCDKNLRIAILGQTKDPSSSVSCLPTVVNARCFRGNE